MDEFLLDDFPLLKIAGHETTTQVEASTSQVSTVQALPETSKFEHNTKLSWSQRVVKGIIANLSMSVMQQLGNDETELATSNDEIERSFEMFNFPIAKDFSMLERVEKDLNYLQVFAYGDDERQLLETITNRVKWFKTTLAPDIVVPQPDYTVHPDNVGLYHPTIPLKIFELKYKPLRKFDQFDNSGLDIKRTPEIHARYCNSKAFDEYFAIEAIAYELALTPISGEIGRSVVFCDSPWGPVGPYFPVQSGELRMSKRENGLAIVESFGPSLIAYPQLFSHVKRVDWPLPPLVGSDRPSWQALYMPRYMTAIRFTAPTEILARCAQCRQFLTSLPQDHANYEKFKEKQNDIFYYPIDDWKKEANERFLLWPEYVNINFFDLKVGLDQPKLSDEPIENTKAIKSQLCVEPKPFVSKLEKPISKIVEELDDKDVVSDGNDCPNHDTLSDESTGLTLSPTTVEYGSRLISGVVYEGSELNSLSTLSDEFSGQSPLLTAVEYKIESITSVVLEGSDCGNLSEVSSSPTSTPTAVKLDCQSSLNVDSSINQMDSDFPQSSGALLNNQPTLSGKETLNDVSSVSTPPATVFELDRQSSSDTMVDADLPQSSGSMLDDQPDQWPTLGSVASVHESSAVGVAPASGRGKRLYHDKTKKKYTNKLNVN